MLEILCKAFVLLVLTTACLPRIRIDREYDLVEFFSGAGRIARLAQCVGYQSMAFDILYDTEAKPGKGRAKAKGSKGRSCMDLNSSAGFLLLLLH